MSYYYKKITPLLFTDAITQIKKSLADAGFGILTEIDVQATLKKKLNKDFIPYIILGACNPPFAHKALEAETEIGLMLPCNVIIYEKDGVVYVAAVRPTQAMRTTGNSELEPIAIAVEEKLKQALDQIGK